MIKHAHHRISYNFFFGILYSASLFGASVLAQTQNCRDPGSGSLFNATLCVEGEQSQVGINSITGLIEQLDTEPMRRRFSGYDEDVAAVEFRIDLRGLPVNLSFARNSTQLVFQVPSIGIYEVFDGGTRDASNDLYEDYMKRNGSKIQKELIAVSPFDPVAGNPASLQSQMVLGDFNAGMNTSINAQYDALSPGGYFGVAPRFGSYTVNGLTQNILTLPISYTYTFSNYDRLILRLPLNYMEVDGAASYQGNISLGYRKNILPIWSVTPAVSYGLTGSSDQGAVGQILSASMTSDLLVYDNDRVRVSMGNMVGHYITLPIDAKGYKSDYDLENTIVRNGLLFSIPLQKRFLNREFSVDFFITDTRFFGDELYSEYYQEIGVSIGPLRSKSKLDPNLSSHPFGLGIKYVTGDGDIDGFEMNFAYRF